VIRVRSAVDEKLKKIKGTKKEREVEVEEEEKEEERKQWIPLYSPFLLFEECVPYNTVYMYCFILSFFFAFALLLTLYFFSRLLRQKRNYTILKCVTDNLHFFGCPIAFQVSCQLFENRRFDSTEGDDVITVVFLLKIFVCLLSLLNDF
jgi:hypothetical protein